MKKFLLIAAVLLVLAVLGLFITVQLTYQKTFEAPYPDISASTDSAAIARGKYLVYGPAHCAHCHSPMEDLKRVDDGELVPLSGGFNFNLPIGMVHAPNITTDPETGIGNYTDAELARALRYGVKKNGQALFDFMPFYDLSDADLTAIVSYLRTQDPVYNKRPENAPNFLGKALLAFAITPQGDGEVPPAPPEDSTAAYGKYLVNSVANCRGCHTNRDLQTGAFIGEELAGGFQMEQISDAGELSATHYYNTPNLTPDPTTGRIFGWTKEAFIQRFRLGKTQPGSAMPWGPFSRMSNLELTAIYNYLQTVAPVKKEIELGLKARE